MQPLFKNNDTNKAAAPLWKEVSNILDALELCDIMMPSNPNKEVQNIELAKKDLFYEIANNTVKFVDFKLTLFELDLKEIKKWVHRDEMQTFYQLSDIVAVCFFKVLGFELGRISYYIRKGERSNKDELSRYKNSIIRVKGFLNRINHFERTEISESEFRKVSDQVSTFEHKLIKPSFLKRIFGVFK